MMRGGATPCGSLLCPLVRLCRGLTAVLHQFLEAMGASEWSTDMAAPDRSEWAVRHHLDRVTVTLSLVDGSLAGVDIAGNAVTKRTRLWTVNYAPSMAHTDGEVLEDLRRDLEVLTACQPMSQDQANDVLRHGTVTWKDQTLPLF